MNHPAHDHRFDVVYKGSWYMLGSLSEHIKHEVPGDKYLLLDNMYRHYIVPRDQVHIAPNRIASRPRKKRK